MPTQRANGTFEKGATKTTGGEGWADLWKRGCFGWEYKSKGKDLKVAYAQLQRYSPALENAPVLTVAGGLRSRTVRDPHELDQYRQPNLRDRARRTRRLEKVAVAQIDVLQKS
jgi:hypothetical protein